MSLTATERAKLSTDRRVATGGRVLRVILPASPTRALERLTAATGENMTELVSRLLLEADAALRDAGTGD